MDYTDQELYKKCVELSFMIKKYRNQFIALLPEVNKRRLFEKHGMHSIYEFGFKLGGLSENTISRVLKLKERLRDKPVLNSMLESGTVGWSKIEVAERIVTSENEKEISEKLETLSLDSLQTMVKDLKCDGAVDFLDETVRKISY